MVKKLGLVVLGVLALAPIALTQTGLDPAQVVVIGCLERAGQGAYRMKDARSGVVHRIEGTVEALDWHVGHKLEVHGTIQGSGSAPEVRVKVNQVIYISTSCS